MKLPANPDLLRLFAVRDRFVADVPACAVVVPGSARGWSAVSPYHWRKRMGSDPPPTLQPVPDNGFEDWIVPML